MGEFGYCHPLDSWEKGYFRDCNGKSNGQSLPGTVIKLEAEQAALGESKIDAQFLGISQQIWEAQIQKVVTSLSVSSSSSSSSSSLLSSSQQDSSFSSSSSLSSDLVQQILLAIQPQVVAAVNSAVASSSSSSSSSSSLQS